MKAGQRRQTLLRHPETDQSFTTLSGEPVQALYSPRDLAGDQDLSGPGDFPYTRGIHREMYRRKLWTIRQFAGFGVPGETNRRFKYLLDQGQTGLSVAFDLPTLMGLDSDDPLSAGEVGKCGVAVDSLRDMESLFEGIDLGRVSTSLTINAPAAIVLAMYVVVAEQQGVARDQIRGTLQNDILKEYIAQKEWIYPPPALHETGDRFHPILHRRSYLPTTAFPSADTTSGRRARQPSRNSRLPSATASSTSSGAFERAWKSMTSLPGFPCSSTPTTISLRKSPSSEPRAGSGLAP